MNLQTTIAIILLTTSWLSAGANQSTPLSINLKEELYRVEDYSTFFFDKNSILDAKQVIKLYHANNFKPLTTDNINFTHSSGTVWLALEIKNSTSANLYFNFRSFYLSKIQVYSFAKENPDTSKTVGASVPFATKEFKSSGYIIEIPNSIGSNKHLVLCAIKINDSAPTIVRGEIATINSIVQNNRLHEAVTMGILSILLVMLFYNTCLFIVTRDILYFHYCCHLIASLIVVAYFNGLLFEWVWPNYPAVNKYPWPMSFYFITQLVFINRMLQIKKIVPAAYKISLGFMGLFAIILITSFSHIALSSVLIFACGVILPLYYAYLISILIKRREKIIYIFMLGWSPMLLITILNSIMTIGLIKYTELFSLHGVEICLAWEVVIFSLALGYRYNLIKQQIITVQDENLNIIENQKNVLEKMVSERTEEILTQNEVLIRNQDHIQLQNDRLEAQNRAYEKLRELILRQNQNLESAVNRRTIELANANQDLKNNIRKIERFNFIAAHNLRGPVARILGLCMLIEKEEVDKDSINYQIIDKLKYSTRELDEIIHDLILILDIQSQNDKNYKSINLRDSIQKTLHQFINDLKNEKFKVELYSTIEIINVIPEYFDNIFINLISNSIKYKKQENENRLTIAIQHNDNDIEIEYSDNGIGFESANFEDKIFEPFQKFHAHADGKGLGLFLIKSQINAMGGKIKLWSKPNMGIRITINLPATVNNQQKNSSELLKINQQPN